MSENPVQELTQEIDRRMFGHLQARVRELEAALTDVLQQKVNELKALAPQGAFSPEDFSIINLMGDVESLAEQLATATARTEEANQYALGMEAAAEAERQRAEAAEAKLLALEVDRSKTVKLRDDTDNVIWSLKPDDVPGAINWGDLGCCEVQEVVNDMRRWFRVIIEEADPSNPALHAAVLAGLTALGWDTDDIELETAW